jgi:hypothetical protein
VGRRPPGKQTDEAVLKDENYADSARNFVSSNVRASVVGGRSDLALNLRKLFVIRGREKAGLLTYFDNLRSTTGSAPSSVSSAGITCCNSLRENRLFSQRFMRRTVVDLWGIVNYFAKNRSCNDKPLSALFELISWSFS